MFSIWPLLREAGITQQITACLLPLPSFHFPAPTLPMLYNIIPQTLRGALSSQWIFVDKESFRPILKMSESNSFPCLCKYSSTQALEWAVWLRFLRPEFPAREVAQTGERQDPPQFVDGDKTLGKLLLLTKLQPLA